MKLAIPVFHTKISPRFDQAQGFVLLETNHSEVVTREDLATRGWPEIDKMRQLVELGIETLICGGIDRASLQYLSFNGVNVYSWVTGEVDDAVTCFLDNRMKPGMILGDQGKMMGRWQFCKGRNHLCNMFQTGFNNGKEGVNSMPNGDGSGPRKQGQGSGMGRGAKKAGKGGRSGGCGAGRGGGKGRGQGSGGRNGGRQNAGGGGRSNSATEADGQ
jgi:predicted Fe-Mo cluster-binding NifX family protein